LHHIFCEVKSWPFGQGTETLLSDRVLHGVNDRPGAKNLSQHSQYLCNFATLSPQHGISLVDSQHAILLAIPAKKHGLSLAVSESTLTPAIFIYLEKTVAFLTKLRHDTYFKQ
jgi:hypothetical protein